MNQDHRVNRTHQDVVLRNVAPSALNRREALTLLGSAIALAAGCSSDDSPMTTPDSGLPPSAEAGEAAAAVAEGGDGAAAVRWAAGGTAKLAESYPDPFTQGLGSSCSITCRETIGPCYATTLVRRDVSEGYPGLPLRLVLLVVDESCSPAAGVTVDIWHTRNTGAYSGDDDGIDAAGTPGGWQATLGIPMPEGGGAPSEGGPMGPSGAELSAACSAGDTDAQKHDYFRGTQTTDATGRVSFDTCYPGWYSGRAIHIHIIVRRDGQESVISQLYFLDELTAEIFTVHPDYAPRGQPDTLNTTDAFFTGLDHVLSTARQPDGAMLAWKTIVLRNSSDVASCGTNGFVRPPIPAAP
jgi:protocatechuate 3,4-dioxygenase beta subunit